MNIPIVEIDEKRNYWLIRTEAGEYYEEFYHDQFVGMGWDELNKFTKEELYDDDFMAEQVQKIYGDKVKQPWRVYTQVRRFVYEVNVGDVVLIPSQSHVSFGVVESEVEYVEVKEFELFEGLCPFQKRRRVKWLKTIRRADLDPYLYKLLNSHFAITNATEYAPYIDRTLHSFYLKGGKAHLVLHVTTQGRVYARDLMQLINGSIKLVDAYNEVNGEKLDPNGIEIKVNVQSPGPVEFISDVWTITVIGMCLVFIVGGKFSIKHTKENTDISAESDGLIEKVLKVIQLFKKNSEQQNEDLPKQIQEPAEKLRVELPEELKKLPESQGE